MVDQVTRLNSDSGSFGDGDIATYLGTAQEDPTMEARVAAGVYILTTCYYLLHVTTYYMLLHTTCYYLLHVTIYYMLLLTTCYYLLHVTTYYMLLTAGGYSRVGARGGRRDSCVAVRGGSLRASSGSNA